MIQVAGLGAFIVRAVEITDAHLLRQGAHLRAAVVIAEPDMHPGRIRVFDMHAAIEGLAQELRRLIVGGNENIHLRPGVFRDLRQGAGAGAEEVAVEDQGFEEAHQLHDEQDNIRCDGEPAGLKGNGAGETPEHVNDGGPGGEDQADQLHFHRVFTVPFRKFADMILSYLYIFYYNHGIFRSGTDFVNGR